MRFIKTIAFVCFVLAASASVGQEHFTYFSNCSSWCQDVHIKPDGSVFTLVLDMCDPPHNRWSVCEPVDNELVPLLIFEEEGYDGFFSTDSGMYVVSQSLTERLFRFIDNDLNVSEAVILDMPAQTSSVRELYVTDNYLVTGHTESGDFTIARFNRLTGEEEESVVYPEMIPFIINQSTLIVEDENTLYFALRCGWVFRTNPEALTETELLPLPYSEELQVEYNPCDFSIFYARPHPADSILFSAFLIGTEETYCYDFGYVGEHLDTHIIHLPDTYNPVDLFVDANGNRFMLCVFNADADYMTDDLSLLKFDAEFSLLDSARLVQDEWDYEGHGLKHRDGRFHLHGMLSFPGEWETVHASYVVMDMDDFSSGVSERNVAAPRFIQTDAVFGIAEASNAVVQELLELSGKRIAQRTTSGLWQKSEFAKGSYIYRVTVGDRVYSYLIGI